MQEWQRNSLLENVNLHFYDYSEEKMAFPITIMPLIASINSVKIFDVYHDNNTYSKLGKTIMKSARVIDT
jgi:hypothetical protein